MNVKMIYEILPNAILSLLFYMNSEVTLNSLEDFQRQLCKESLYLPLVLQSCFFSQNNKPCQHINRLRIHLRISGILWATLSPSLG